MTAYEYTRINPDGEAKTVGPFRTPKEAQRFVAQALVDNGHSERSDAARFARTVTLKGDPQVHCPSGITYSIGKVVEGSMA